MKTSARPSKRRRSGAAAPHRSCPQGVTATGWGPRGPVPKKTSPELGHFRAKSLGES